MQKIIPCLWFDGKAEEAASFYVSIFENSKIKGVTHYGSGGPLPKGTAMTVSFVLRGEEYLALNGGPHFSFSPAVSFIVKCDTQEELDAFSEKLSAVPEREQCGWVQDKYGLSWQIVPTELPALVGGGDAAKSGRVMAALMKMKRLDIAQLKKAAEG